MNDDIGVKIPFLSLLLASKQPFSSNFTEQQSSLAYFREDLRTTSTGSNGAQPLACKNLTSQPSKRLPSRRFTIVTNS
jgi:hypothetical protein